MNALFGDFSGTDNGGFLAHEFHAGPSFSDGREGRSPVSCFLGLLKDAHGALSQSFEAAHQVVRVLGLVDHLGLHE